MNIYFRKLRRSNIKNPAKLRRYNSLYEESLAIEISSGKAQSELCEKTKRRQKWTTYDEILEIPALREKRRIKLKLEENQ